MSLAAWTLTEAIYGALNGNLTYGGAAVPVYDGTAPSDAAFPYVVLGEMTGNDRSGKTAHGEDISLTIHVWSRYRGRKETTDILSRIDTLLTDESLSLTGHTLVRLRREFFTDFPDPDGLTHHGVIRFGALTSET